MRRIPMLPTEEEKLDAALGRVVILEAQLNVMEKSRDLARECETIQKARVAELAAENERLREALARAREKRC
jgi:hypothetical protein